MRRREFCIGAIWATAWSAGAWVAGIYLSATSPEVARLAVAGGLLFFSSRWLGSKYRLRFCTDWRAFGFASLLGLSLIGLLFGLTPRGWQGWEWTGLNEAELLLVVSCG